MVIKFAVENFLSFSDRQVLDFSPEPLTEHKDHLHVPYLYDPNFFLLKSLAIYGHNSHGKSNMLKAYQFFRKTIFDSFSFGKQENYLDVDYFKLNTKNKSIPTVFEIIFLLRETKYRYSFEIKNSQIVKEGLWYAENKTRENYLFERLENDILLSKIWSKQSEKISQSVIFTKPHNLFLSVLFSQNGIPRIESILNWFQGNLIISDNIDNDDLKKAVLILTQEEYRNTIQTFIQHADIGFKSITEKIDSYSSSKIKLERNFLNLFFSHELQSFEIYSRHDLYDENKEWLEHVYFELLKSESGGSIKYLILACYLTFAIKSGQLILIDELDSRLHPLLLSNMIKLFNSHKKNVIGSQMIFTIHNTSVLNNKHFRRDQIYFVTKSKYGESSVRRMHTKKNPIRLGTSIEKNYLNGELGLGISESLKNNPGNLFDF